MKNIEKEIICDACGRNLRINNMSISGITIFVRTDDDRDKEYFKSVYPELSENKSYNVCFVCLLKNLGVSL